MGTELEIEIAGRGVGDSSRHGEILEVLGVESSPHYRVRWEDGHESILYPGETTRVRRLARRAPSTPPQTHRLIEKLSAMGIEFEVLPHRRTTTALAEAQALGIRAETAGKTIVVRAGNERVRALVPASERLDVHKLERVIGARPVLLSEVELADEFPDIDLGAVPPVGGDGDRLVVDARIAGLHSVIVEAGSHELSIRVAPRALIELTHADVADIAA